MISQDKIEKIESLANQVATREGVRIYSIEFAGGYGGRTLRICIDKEGGVGIDDCANVSRGLNLLLDEQDPIPGGSYQLEVSSPGLERLLLKPWHFEQVIGKKVWIKTTQSFESLGSESKKFTTAKQVTETLLGVAEDGVRIELDGSELVIPFAAIEKAQLIHDFGPSPSEKKGMMGGGKKGKKPHN